MKAITRVEKYQKLREKIYRMPDENVFSNNQKSPGYAIAQTKKAQPSNAQSSISTYEYSFKDVMEGVSAFEIDEQKSISPITKYRRKELIQTITLISILILLVIGVIIIGILAF